MISTILAILDGRSRLVVGAAVVTTLMCPAALEARDQNWQWTVTPYLWATNVSAKVSVGNRQVLNGTLSVTDLLKDLDMTAQARVEVQHRKNGVMVDVFNSELSKNGVVPVPAMGGIEASLNSRVGMTILDAGGIYSPLGDREGFALLYGSRVFVQRTTVDAAIDVAPSVTTTAEKRLNETLVDALAGARFARHLSRRWQYAVRAEASTGGTRDSWSVGGGLSCDLGQSRRYAATVGYRYMAVDFYGDHALDVHVTLSGVATGIRMTF